MKIQISVEISAEKVNLVKFYNFLQFSNYKQGYNYLWNASSVLKSTIQAKHDFKINMQEEKT